MLQHTGVKSPNPEGPKLYLVRYAVTVISSGLGVKDQPMSTKEKKLRGIAERFAKFHGEFAPFFQTKTRDSSEIAGQYLNGLVQAPKKNMERMEEKVPESDNQALQHFVTNSPWDEKALLKKVVAEADKLLGGKEDSCLLIDETSFPKKGKKSVGVQTSSLD